MALWARMAQIDERQLESNWGALQAEALVGTQTLSQLTQEAEAFHLSSASASQVLEVLENSESEEPLPTQSWHLKPTAPWWAYRLVHLTKQYDRNQCHKPVNIISGCTGVSAESFVMKAGFIA